MAMNAAVPPVAHVTAPQQAAAMAAPGRSTVGRRLSVNVALDVGDAIDTLSTRHQITITDVIRRAVSTYKFIDDEMQDGGKILVERDGIVREVKFL